MPLNTHELPLAKLLLDCLRGALTVDHPNPPTYFSLRVGEEVAHDLSQYEDLCCEGLAYVKINTVYPSSQFPQPDDTYSPCQMEWATDLEMGVLRCAPVGDLEHIPTDAEWTATAEQVAHDSAAMRAAIASFCNSMEPGAGWLPRPWSPVGAQGGCTGGTQVLTVGFIQDGC